MGKLWFVRGLSVGIWVFGKVGFIARWFSQSIRNMRANKPRLEVAMQENDYWCELVC